MILLVDAAQGIEAQTLANCYLALENDLEIVAALNKIDLPAADPERYAEEIEQVLGIPAEEMLLISAKTGEGVPELLDAVVERIPPPVGRPRRRRCRRSIFDSHFDQYRGVISSIRVMNGTLRTGAKLRFMQAGAAHDADEVGVPAARAHPGQGARPGRGRLPDRRHQGRRRGPLRRDRHRRSRTRPPSRSTATASPSRWCSAGSTRSTATSTRELREALEKLRLNDASFTYEPETSGALGFGFRCGFLGLLHMEIIRERLEREFDLSLIATAPSVEYRVTRRNGDRARRRQPVRDAARWPRSSTSRSRT